MVAGVRLSPHRAVDARRRQPRHQIGRQQEMVDPQPRVAPERVPEIIPEGIECFGGMDGAERIGPALIEQALISLPDLWSEQRVIVPSLRTVDVEFRRHDIEVADENDRGFCQ